MARTFAQHAEAGLYHLETRYCEPNRWEWTVFGKGKKGNGILWRYRDARGSKEERHDDGRPILRQLE